MLTIGFPIRTFSLVDMVVAKLMAHVPPRRKKKAGDPPSTSQCEPRAPQDFGFPGPDPGHREDRPLGTIPARFKHGTGWW